MGDGDAGGTQTARQQATIVRGQWLVLAAAVLWGTTGTAQAFAPASASSFSVGAVRLALGGILLLAFAAVRGELARGRRLPLLPTLVAAGGIAAYQLFFFSGVARTGVAMGTLVGIGSAPIWAGAIAWLLRRDRPGGRWLVATGLAIAGCSLLISGGSAIQVDPLGVVLALGAGLTYAIYTQASKDMLLDQPPDKVMAVVFFLGALFLVPILFFSDLGWLAEPRGLTAAMHLGVITVAVAYALFARGLNTIPAATAVTLTLAEPLTAATLGIFVLGEQLTSLALTGMALLFAGLALLTVGRSKPAQPIKVN